MFLVIFWAIEIFEVIINRNFHNYGILPRNTDYLSGILFSPFLHEGFPHLISNSLPFFILGTAIFFFYPRVSLKAVLLIYILSGLGVWIFARSTNEMGADLKHIGASGVIYGFVGFLFFSGIFRRSVKSILIAFVIAILYGGLIFGVFPTNSGISWEGHLAGAIAGALVAWIFRKSIQTSKQEE